MRIGVPREIKIHEHRVGLTPAATRELTQAGHQVQIETGAGVGAGFPDSEYQAAGADVLTCAEQLFARSELIVKVKEPQLEECARLRQGQMIFAYLHLAADPDQARALMQSGVTAIAYETVSAAGALPLLTPMSRIAGRMATQVGAHYLEKPAGGAGILLGGVPGVESGRVLVLGAGTAGQHAAEMAVGLQAQITVIDKCLDRLNALSERFGNRIHTLGASAAIIEAQIAAADLVIGSVLVPGAAAPKLVSRSMVKAMRPGSVIVDVSIDQGGCFESSRPTNHTDPVYVEDGVIHYCVTNMPGAVPRTATQALVNATLPFIQALADRGWQHAMQRDRGLADGLNVHSGRICHPAVAESLGLASDAPVQAA